MTLICPSMSGPAWRCAQPIKPRILVLEVRDRLEPDDQVLAWLIVEREEHYEPIEGDVFEAWIRLSYRRVVACSSSEGEGKGYFTGAYSRTFGSVSLTSSTMSAGAVFLDPPELQGLRVGTYLMNEIVQWAKQWPEATVNPIHLDAGQASSDNKGRRNRFYERFGLVFDYADPEQRAGVSRPMPARDLICIESWQQNITEHQVLNYIGHLLHEREHLAAELQALDRACAEITAERRAAEARPLRWALLQLYDRYTVPLVATLVLAGLAWMLWVKLTVQ